MKTPISRRNFFGWLSAVTVAAAINCRLIEATPVVEQPQAPEREMGFEEFAIQDAERVRISIQDRITKNPYSKAIKGSKVKPEDSWVNQEEFNFRGPLMCPYMIEFPSIYAYAVDAIHKQVERIFANKIRIELFKRWEQFRMMGQAGYAIGSIDSLQGFTLLPSFHDPMPLRFNSTSWRKPDLEELIEPEIAVATTHGYAIGVNPAWVQANHEIGFTITHEPPLIRLTASGNPYEIQLQVARCDENGLKDSNGPYLAHFVHIHMALANGQGGFIANISHREPRVLA